jgi:hypothetical protein
MLVRLRAVGLAEEHACDLLITQVELADAFGLTPGSRQSRAEADAG